MSKNVDPSKPIFPIIVGRSSFIAGEYHYNETLYTSGITMREHFALHLHGAILSTNSKDTPEIIAEIAVDHANALIYKLHNYEQDHVSRMQAAFANQ